jgi:hypothetical protein
MIKLEPGLLPLLQEQQPEIQETEQVTRDVKPVFNDDNWTSKKLEDFLFYNCPDCDFKCGETDNFLIHAHQHSKAREFIQATEEDLSSMRHDATEFVDCDYYNNTGEDDDSMTYAGKCSLWNLFGVSSESPQSLFRVSSESLQSLFRVSSESLQSLFRVSSEFLLQ